MPKVGAKLHQLSHARIFSVLLCQNLIPCFLTFCSSERSIPTHFLNFIYSTWTQCLFKILEYLCYDDGCHLKRYANKQQRRDLIATSKLLQNISIVDTLMHGVKITVIQSSTLT